MLRQLGHTVRIATTLDDPTRCDLLIALHARKSHAAIKQFRVTSPTRPLFVALTGTDLYDDIPAGNRHALESLELADRLLTLHARARLALPVHVRSKVALLYQSVCLPAATEQPPRTWHRFMRQCKMQTNITPLVVCVIGHLRDVKDPLLTARAVLRLPEASRIQLLHLGAVTSVVWKRRAIAEMSRNPRYHWLGSVSHQESLRILQLADVLCLTSKLEGGANVVMEALACGKPILSTRIEGSLGLLGTRYPGYFPVGNAVALSRLLNRFENQPAFRTTLKRHIQQLKDITRPSSELHVWRRLLDEIKCELYPS